jgi:hypothetical protein
MDKLKLIQDENHFVRIERAGNGFVGIICHPDTGYEIERVYSDTERGVRAKIVRFTYSTLPMNSTR